ncbi:MAG: glycoside hydrolase family 15 protein [Deltaproteobacteria bacterium]|nr:MAG: glycoside hydrolase family 15 protein [Deltaproteobacteria bacterium]TMB37833.1 MAG: glycoside hydrolase family 15 protein [Deltaproteobacteria bacterium]
MPAGPASRVRGIGRYAIIGDCRSAALVSDDGSVDWLCWPRFDSDAVFAALLDAGKGGRFAIRPAGEFRVERAYAPQTNVLLTRFSTPDGSAVLTDFMPVQTEEERARILRPDHELVRILRCDRGEMQFEAVFEPRPRFAQYKVELRDRRNLGVRCHTRDGLLALRSEEPLEPRGDSARAIFTLRAGETRTFAISFEEEGPSVLPALGDDCQAALDHTLRFWRSWASHTVYDGPYRDAVVRSALTLKLLAYAPSGAVVAAPTTSLPERPGGSLNWDYRYCWLRDAALTSRALFGLGHRDEAEAFVSWLLTAASTTWPRVHVLYDVFGRPPPEERELPHLRGYEGARPVRVGNAAKSQLQLDLYGELVGAVRYFVEHGGELDRAARRMLGGLGRSVCEMWRQPDHGIWEERGERKRFTHSRVMCWAALDGLVHLARELRIDLKAPVESFAGYRDLIREEIEELGYSRALRSYTRAFAGADTDASLLLLPWYGYIEASAPRMRSTFERIRRELGLGGVLFKRYEGPLTEGEGAFGICSFWAAECLALGGGTLEEATALFEEALGYANDVGLFAEEIVPETGEALGNFPQAFTHLGVVNAALTLEERRKGSSRPSRAEGAAR